MSTFGYSFVLLGILMLRQVAVGRAHETPGDVRDLFVALVHADSAGIKSVFSERGTNVAVESGSVAAQDSTTTTKDGGPVTVSGDANRVGSKAIAHGLSVVNAGTHGYHNWCLRFVQECYAAAGVPTPSQGNAANGATNSAGMHRTTDYASIPPGVPLWWNGGDGHVALSTGGGNAISTDYPKDDVANVTTIKGLVDWLDGSHMFLGWSESFTGTKVFGSESGGSGVELDDDGSVYDELLYGSPYA